MNALRARLPVFAAALWWGSLTAICAVAVPLLFSALPSKSMAGFMAARLFTAQMWISIGCELVLLLMRAPPPVPAEASPSISTGRAGMGLEPFILAGLLLAFLLEFAVAPKIVTRQDLALWHTAGSAMMLAQWLCAGAVLWRLSRPAS